MPAEEFIDVEERAARVAKGEIEFMLGKPELVAKGHFDDVDMAMMIHTGSRDAVQDAGRSRRILEWRAGQADPVSWQGGACRQPAAARDQRAERGDDRDERDSAQRETFWDKDTIRIHPIITKGGDAVSVVPAEVTMETFVRGGSLEAIVDANTKVDRCLRAGAMAMGAEVEIHTIPGYLPQRNDRAMGEFFGGNVEALFGPGEFDIGGHRTGSTDMGDLAHLMPVIHPYVVAAEGKAHGADWRINEPEHGYLTPAKLLAMTAIDLLYGDAAPARNVIADFKPVFTKESYLAFARGLFKKERYSGTTPGAPPAFLLQPFAPRSVWPRDMSPSC